MNITNISGTADPTIFPTVFESIGVLSSVNVTATTDTTTATTLASTLLRAAASVVTTAAAGPSGSTVAPIDSLGAFRISICVIGSIANLVVIIAILATLQFKKHVTSWYILQLAIADLIFLLTIPLKVIEDQHNAWIYSDGMCKALQSILFINYYASITFLTVMAVDRYIAICHSFSDRLRKLRSKRVAYIITVFVWALCILLCLPVMLYTNVQGINPNCKCNLIFPKPPLTAEEKCIQENFPPARIPMCLRVLKFTDDKYCQDRVTKDKVGLPRIPTPAGGTTPAIDDSKLIHQGCQYISASPGFRSFLYYNFFGMFLVPFLIICVCYALIIIYVKKTQFRRDHGNDKKSASQRNRSRIVIMCAALVVVFVICWLPYHAQHMAKMNGIVGKSTEFCQDIALGTTLLIYLNSAINPFLYSLIAQCRTKVQQVKSTRAGTALATLFTKNTGTDNSRASRSGSSGYVGGRKESAIGKSENISSTGV